jgi:mannosyltransferase OCH1-like enzyme
MSLKIPQLIHQVWVGEKVLPDKDVGWCETVKRHHPDWQHIMWAEHPENVPKGGPWDSVRSLPDLMLDYCIPVIKERAGPRASPAAIADIVRMEVLLQNGGVYFDTDVIIRKSCFNLFQDKTLAICEEFSCHMIGNFFLLATRDHPATYACLSEFREQVRIAVRSGANIDPIYATGPAPTSRVFERYQDRTLFPFPVFCPWNPDYPLPDDVETVPWSPWTHGIHLFSAKWTQIPRKSRGTVEDGLQPYWKG